MPGGSVSPLSGNQAQTLKGTTPSQSPWDFIKNALTGLDALNTQRQAAPLQALGVPREAAMQSTRDFQAATAEPVNTAISGVLRPLTTAALAINPDSQDFLSLSASWRDSASVTPAQAIQSLPVNQANLYSAITGKNLYGVPTSEVGVHGGIDPTNEAVRQQAYHDNLLGQVSTGLGDAVIQYFLAPDVIAGQVAKPVVASARGQRLLSAGERAKAAQFNADISAGRPTATDTYTSGLRDIWDNRNNEGFVRNHAVIQGASNPGLLSSVLARSADANEWTTAYMAARGDPRAITALRQQAPLVAGQLQRADASVKGLNGTIAKFPLPKRNADGTLTDEFAVTLQTRDEMKAQVADLTKRDAWYQQAIGAPGVDGINTTKSIFEEIRYQTVGRSSKVNAQRARNAAWEAQAWGDRMPGYWVDQVYKPLGQDSMSVRVRNWMGGEVPTGYVALSGAAAVNSDKEILAHLNQAGAPDAMKRDFLTRWNAAYTPDAREAIALEMDSALTKHTLTTFFEKKGVLDATDRSRIEDRAGEIMAKYHQQRSSLMAQVKSDEGYLWDVGANQAIKVKQLESQQAQLHPLTDFKVMNRALKQAKGDELELLRGAKTLGTAGLNTFSELWKASVLLRLGALPKNLGESWLASYIYLGKTAGNPLGGIGTGLAKASDASFNFVGRSTRAMTRRAGKAWQGAKDGTYDPRFSTYDDDLAVMQGKINEHEAVLKSARLTMANLVQDAREAGGEQYYQQAERLGVRHSVLDVQAGVATDLKPYLPKRQRAEYNDLFERNYRNQPLTRKEQVRLQDLHGKAARTHLRKQQGTSEVMAKRDGQWTPVDNMNDLSDAELYPGRSPLGYAKEPDIYLMPKYKQAIKGAPDKNLVGGKPGVYDVGAKRRSYQPSGIVGDDARVWGTAADAVDRQNEVIANIEADIGLARDDYVALQDIVQRVRNPLRGKAKSNTIQVGKYEADSADAGEAAEIMKKNVSARSKNRLLQHSLDVDGAIQSSFMRRLQSGGLTQAHYPDKMPEYVQAGAHFANTNVRNSPLSLKLLGGADPAEVAQELMNPANKGTLKALATRNDSSIDEATAAEVHQWTMELQHNLYATFPDERLRARIVERSITPQDMHSFVAGRDIKTLVPIYDDGQIPLPPQTGKQFVDHLIDKAFDYLWSLPEDNLARWPLYRQIYDTHIHDSINDNMAFLDGLPKSEADAFIFNHIVPAAREHAMATVKKVVYSAERRTVPADTLRFLSPFFQVTANRFNYYGGQLLENPQNMARLFNTWNSIQTVKDQYGQQVVALHLPGWVAKILGVEDTPDLKINKSYLNLINSGEPWYSPGSGPIVQVPLGKFMRDHPEDNDLLGKVQKFLKPIVGSQGLGIFQGDNYGTSIIVDSLPTVARRVLASKDQQYWNTYTEIAVVEAQKYREGLRTTMPTTEEIQDRANQMWMFRIATAEISPAQPTVGNAAFDNITSLYRTYQQSYGKQADTKFLADHPEMYDFAVTMSKNNTGQAATDSAVGRANANSALINSLGDKTMSALVTNTPDDQGKFDADAYHWQYGREVSPGTGISIRGPQSPEDVANQKVVQRGWIAYADAAKKRDALLLDAKVNGGSNSINAKDNLWIKLLFDQDKQAILDSTSYKAADGTLVSPWWADFQTQNNGLYAQRAQDLGRIVDNPGYVDKNSGVQTWLPAARQYVQARADINSLLADQKAQGGSSSITASDNLWIKILWDQTNADLDASNPAWADIRNQKFAHDDLQEVGG